MPPADDYCVSSAQNPSPKPAAMAHPPTRPGPRRLCHTPKRSITAWDVGRPHSAISMMAICPSTTIISKTASARWLSGRSNWLFAGSLRAGQRAAAIMSLIQSAKLNGHDPYRYLKDVLERLPTQPASRIENCFRIAGRRNRSPL